MKVYKGAILTCDSQNTVAKYLVEQKGRIVYVGDELPEKYAAALECGSGEVAGEKGGGVGASAYAAELVDLGGRALIPAFADTHIHFASYATFHAGLNVMNAQSNAEILNMLREFVKTCKDKLVIGFGASPYSVSDGCLVTRRQLDEVCPDKPLFLVKYDGHACVVNTKLLEKVRKKVQNLRGYHEESGEMNQEAFFAVSDYVTNSIPILQLVKNMQKAVDDLAERGIGMIHTVSGVGFTGDLDVDLERWFAAGLDNGMQIRVFMQTMDVQKAFKRGMTRIGGCFEAALDGCFGSADAALREPYADTSVAGDCCQSGPDYKGVLYYDDERVTEFCKAANRAHMQIEIHAIGDAAFDQATRALKAALDDYPREDHRHAIIHACLPTAEGIEICRNYKIQIPVQSAFIGWAQEPDSYLQQLLGPERAAKLNPLRDFWDAEILLSAGSDGPCTDPDPIQWIHRACNHSVSEQSLTVQEALKMCTYNGYYSTFDEGSRGSLELGKIADMVILSENPYEMETSRLCELKAEQLLLGGAPYRKASGSPVGQVVKGLLKSRKA